MKKSELNERIDNLRNEIINRDEAFEARLLGLEKWIGYDLASAKLPPSEMPPWESAVGSLRSTVEVNHQAFSTVAGKMNDAVVNINRRIAKLEREEDIQLLIRDVEALNQRIADLENQGIIGVPEDTFIRLSNRVDDAFESIKN